ncbi:MAG TPA: hypothetical protein DCM08_03640 [Microscillaceae bacterium]|jgi:DNA-binding NarL/FixJ family response regulator|nr:hypothetical protein [Microscillaceae bacterium]
MATLSQYLAPNEQMPDFTKLTKKELEIVRLLTKGLSTKEICAKMGISENTVEYHKKNIYAKCNIRNKTTLVAFFLIFEYNNGFTFPQKQKRPNRRHYLD